MTDIQRCPGEGSRGGANDQPAGEVSTEGSAGRAVIRLWREALAKSKQESQARRGRVLAHEDLAQRLKEPPLRLTEPARWSGWIPPKTGPERACTYCGHGRPRPACSGLPHRARVNGSPVRRQLVEIAAEAYARESGQ